MPDSEYRPRHGGEVNKDAPGDETYGLTLRELVLEVRSDLKELKALTATKEDSEDHEDRVRRLERWMYGIPISFIAAIGAVLSNIVR